jgi:hypothetical protein
MNGDASATGLRHRRGLLYLVRNREVTAEPNSGRVVTTADGHTPQRRPDRSANVSSRSRRPLAAELHEEALAVRHISWSDIIGVFRA